MQISVCNGKMLPLHLGLSSRVNKRSDKTTQDSGMYNNIRT